MDMDDFINQFVEDFSFEDLVVWADILDIEVNPPPLDDMYPDWDNELRIEVAEQLVNALALSKIKQKT